MNSTSTPEPIPETTAPKPVAEPTPQAALAVAGDDPSRMLSAFSSEQAFRVGQRMAMALSRSSLMPKAYQGEENLPNVLIAMELANRIGASVFMVAQNLDIIHGRPGWRSQFLIATVNASRRFTPLRFRWSGTEGTEDWGCRAYARDAGSGDECVGALITIRMARAEGWATKQGSKWVTMPEQMMMYRAAAFWTRVYCPELALGIHTAEEVQDMTIDMAPTGPSPAADLEARVRAVAPPVVVVTPAAPPVETKVETKPEPAKADAPAPEPAMRNFAQELNTMRGEFATAFDDADGDKAKIKQLRERMIAFCAEAPKDVAKDALAFWQFLTGTSL